MISIYYVVFVRERKRSMGFNINSLSTFAVGDEDAGADSISMLNKDFCKRIHKRILDTF